MHWEKNIVRPVYMTDLIATFDGWAMVKRSYFRTPKHAKETFTSAIIAGLSVLGSMVGSAITHLPQFHL